MSAEPKRNLTFSLSILCSFWGKTCGHSENKHHTIKLQPAVSCSDSRSVCSEVTVPSTRSFVSPWCWSKSVVCNYLVDWMSFHHRLCRLQPEMFTALRSTVMPSLICSMCERNVCRTKAVARCISEAGKKLSFLLPAPWECWCLNWGVTAEHTGHECEEFCLLKSLAGAFKHASLRRLWCPDITQVSTSW